MPDDVQRCFYDLFVLLVLISLWPLQLLQWLLLIYSIITMIVGNFYILHVLHLKHASLLPILPVYCYILKVVFPVVSVLAVYQILQCKEILRSFLFILSNCISFCRKRLQTWSWKNSTNLQEPNQAFWYPNKFQEMLRKGIETFYLEFSIWWSCFIMSSVHYSVLVHWQLLLRKTKCLWRMKTSIIQNERMHIVRKKKRFDTSSG